MGSRARMLVKLCEPNSSNDNIEDQSFASNSINSTSNETFTAEQRQDSNVILNIDSNDIMNYSSQPSPVTENISPLNDMDSPSILANDENGNEGEGKDFSADDSGDDYIPPKPVQRRRINSTSSSSSTNSASSTSSSSSSDSTSSANSTSTTHNSVRNSNLVHVNNDLEPLSETTVTKKGKKRVRNESAWIKNVRKRQRNSGKQYISTSGKTVIEKSIKPPCPEKCRLKCRNKITEEQRQEIFNCYWGLGTLQRQRDFLNSCLTTLKVPYRRVKEGSTKTRTQNCVFQFMLNGESKRTCKLFFMNTLGISERTLRTVIDSRNSSSTGVVPEDKRGKHGHHNQINPEIIQSVRDHINSVPRIESHYTRANTTREFIDGGLTVKELHRNYISIRGTMPPASFDIYYRIFNTEFNLSFFTPKKDQCDLCESYKNAIGEEQLKLKESYEKHLKQKDLSRVEKAKDIELVKEDGDTVVAIYDLQAVMPVPLGNSSAFFYKSKLNCFNFTVTNLKDNITNCYFWHEGLGNRGAVEIGSCVLKFLEETAACHPNSNIIFYSDNCCGQQKNRFLLGMYYYAVETLPIKSITHKYLIRGHTQNEGDNAHSLIEKSIKRAKKSGPIYIPYQYVQLIRDLKKTGNAFVVNELNYDDFYDIKKLFDDIALNVNKDMQGNPIKLSEIKAIRFLKSSDTYDLKYTYESEWITVKSKITINTRKTRSDNNLNITEIRLRTAYNSKLTISDQKKQDLRTLLEKNIIPRCYSGFYESLF